MIRLLSKIATEDARLQVFERNGGSAEVTVWNTINGINKWSQISFKKSFDITFVLRIYNLKIFKNIHDN